MLCIYLEGKVGSCVPASVNGPPKTCIVLFLINYCKAHHIAIKAVRPPPSSTSDSDSKHWCDIHVAEETRLETVSYENIPDSVKQCELPCLVNSNSPLILTGLCTLLRAIVKSASSNNSCESYLPLLGHKEICLKACAEVSAWTRFCEVDLPLTVGKCLSIDACQDIVLSDDLLKLENHLSQPPAVANINKWKRKRPKRQEDRSSPADPTSCEEQSRFAEGYEVTLADVVLLPSLALLLCHWHLTTNTLAPFLPHLVKWYQSVCKLPSVITALAASKLPTIPDCDESSLNLTRIQPLEDTSRCLSIRNVEKKKVKASASQLEQVLLNVNMEPLVFPEQPHPCLVDNEMQLPWQQLPHAVNPAEGELPLERVERKCQQLESLASAVKRLARPGHVIVDFCSGGGHLGILVAYLLPGCKVVMVENKEESNARAEKRIRDLKLTNIFIYQGNLDYYIGHFDIGMCLHACGVATDLVMQRCLDNQASFVVCPCCYGFIHDTHTMQYPRSSRFRNMQLKYKTFLSLCHAADQPHKHDTCDGKKFMRIVDGDRAAHAREHGYDVTLCSLHPLTCSPKNNLLIGTFPHQLTKDNT